MIHVSRLTKSVNVLKDLVQYAMSLVEEEEQEGEEEEVCSLHDVRWNRSINDSK